MSFSIDPRLQDGEARGPAPYQPSPPATHQSANPYYTTPAPQAHPAQQHPGTSSTPHAADHDARDYGQDEDPNATPEQDDHKRPRACESCRGLKVRCDSTTSDAPCRRCAKAGRQCIYTQPSRKRQKKADTRVADLEKKLDALTAALHAQHYAPGALPPIQSLQQSVSPPVQSSDVAASVPVKRRRIEQDPQPSSTSFKTAETPSSRSADAAQGTSTNRWNRRNWDTLDKVTSDRLRLTGLRPELYPMDPEALVARICDLIDPIYHDRIFKRFVGEYLPNLPALAFPPDMTARMLLETKPALFLVICNIAGRHLVGKQAIDDLHDEAIHLLAIALVHRNIKSLELVQVLLTWVLWWRPPDGGHHHSFYMLVHMAAVMALDLGLGKRFNLIKARRGFEGPASELPPGRITALVDADSAEARRTWLACYYTTSAVSIQFRRPNLIRWTNYMQECVEFLESSRDAAVTDKLFCQFIRIQKICEDISVSFQMDDPSATAISISDPKVSYTLDVYEQKLKDWEAQLPLELKAEKRVLTFCYDVAVLYLHEIALHVNHNVDDFQLPFTEERLKSVASNPEVLTQRQMAALEACLHAAHRVIETYCGFGLEVAETMPALLSFVRAMYAGVVLIKMHMAVIAPGSQVAKIIKPEDVRVVEYMDMLWNLFIRIDAHSEGPSGKATKILGILREWIKQHGSSDSSGQNAATATTTTTASRTLPYGHNANNISNKLQVLSEAATAEQPRSRDVATAGKQAFAQDWTFDSASMFVRRPRAADGSGIGPWNMTPDSTPRDFNSVHSQAEPTFQPNNGDNLGAGLPMFFTASGTDNLDWTAGMDLGQVLDGAFREIDTSGDLGGWFFGDGVGAYQLPTEAATPTGIEKPAEGRPYAASAGSPWFAGVPRGPSQ